MVYGESETYNWLGERYKFCNTCDTLVESSRAIRVCLIVD